MARRKGYRLATHLLHPLPRVSIHQACRQARRLRALCHLHLKVLRSVLAVTPTTHYLPHDQPYVISVYPILSSLINLYYRIHDQREQKNASEVVD